MLRKRKIDVYRGKTVLRPGRVLGQNFGLASLPAKGHGLLNMFTAGDVWSASGFLCSFPFHLTHRSKQAGTTAISGNRRATGRSSALPFPYGSGNTPSHAILWRSAR